MNDPLHPGPIRPTDSVSVPPAAPEDDRPWWKRLISSLRPTATIETDKKTGKHVETVGVKGEVDF